MARATDALRATRAGIRARLQEVAEKAGAVTAGPPAARAATMREVVAGLDRCLRGHLEWEERTLHPVVDKFACEGPRAFSASMRYEHDIIHRGMAELARRAGDPEDAAGFVRHADRLLGVVLAHFELEEAVFFPILDETAAGRAIGGPLSPALP
ncbi:Hemerythrin HHE cation binding domain protein [Anaeromyxobacter sp. K]|uniref:hemerythrin domain-containing protein n=1 Tax=Anaeromyxobacter sp. (strain K) TaxID=447217 RepID=UPI00015F972D|nr:hemerythrin domain-containing protein [Anaeromyxobacter sp. K]ACG72970.1 Hemerythrin HHE cation binding domain protein [Anaeromyxobacter sp. K]